MSRQTKLKEADEIERRADAREKINDLGGASVGVVGQARDSAIDVITGLADRAPAAVAASQETVDRIATQLRASSSDSLVLGTVFSVGVWCGLALARAPRLAMQVAILPALILSGTLLSRRVPGTRPLRGSKR